MGYAYDYSYDYPVNSGMSDSVFAVVMSIYLIVIMLALLLFIVEYVFRGIGLYTIGKEWGKVPRGLRLYRLREPISTVNLRERSR